MSGLFNGHLTINKGQIIAIVSGIFVRKIDALGRTKGYLSLDGYPQLEDWVFEIDEESPALYANDAQGPIAFQKHRLANAEFYPASLIIQVDNEDDGG